MITDQLHSYTEVFSNLVIQANNNTNNNKSFGTRQHCCKMIFGGKGRGSCTGLAMVPLDRELLSSYRLSSVCTILLSVMI